MKQNISKVMIGALIALFLIVVSIRKIDGSFFAYLSELLSGSYKEQVAKIEGTGSSMLNEGENRTPSSLIKKCSFESKNSPTHSGAIFNEIAWMGNNEDTKNEWITLKRISTNEIDISHWQIINQSGKLHITIPKGKILSKDKQFYTISRQTKIDGIIPDFVFIGIVKNSNEVLRLFNNKCELIDEVSANPNWPAGDNGSDSLTTGKTKKPMVRLANLSWQTKGNLTKFTTSEIKVPTTQILITTPTPTCININTASKSELTKIIHIGEKTAEKIIDYRSSSTFSSVDELTNINGIGSSTLKNIKEQGLACISN